MEQLAALFIAISGYRIIARNFTATGGEVDIIATRHDLLVFVEVRYRARADFGSGLDSVDIHKQQRIIHTARSFLARHRSYAHHQCRFDVVSISRPNYFPRLQWTRNAFSHDDDPTPSSADPAAAARSLRILQ